MLEAARASCSSEPADSRGLHDLLRTSALGPDVFFEEHWERRHAHWRCADRRAGAPCADRFGLSVGQMLEFVGDMDGIGKALDAGGKGTVQAHVRLASADSSKCGNRGHCKFTCSSGTGCAQRRWSDGWSIVVSSAHMLLEPLSELLGVFWRHLGLYVNANLYLSPSGSGAFNYHADETDVFALQLEGEKRWEVCGRRLPDVNAPAVKWDAVDTTAEWYQALVTNCTSVELKRGDVLYLPIGTIHRAHGTGVDSLHCTVGVDRTFDVQGKANRGFDWVGLLGLSADQLWRAKKRRAGAERFIRWLNEAATEVGADALRRLPRAWSFDALAAPGEEAAATCGMFPAGANALVRSIDGEADLPCRRGAEEHTAGECMSLDELLRREYTDHIAPLLLERASGASTEVTSRLTELTRFMQDGDVISVMRTVRSRMQETMPPLELVSGYGGRQPVAGASDAANVFGDTLVRRPRELRVHVDHAAQQLRANVRTVDWPQELPPRWQAATAWALSAYVGAAGREFSAGQLHKALQTCAWGSACAIRERESALHVVRWLVELRLLEVV